TARPGPTWLAGCSRSDAFGAGDVIRISAAAVSRPNQAAIGAIRLGNWNRRRSNGNGAKHEGAFVEMGDGFWFDRAPRAGRWICVKLRSAEAGSYRQRAAPAEQPRL